MTHVRNLSLRSCSLRLVAKKCLLLYKIDQVQPVTVHDLEPVEAFPTSSSSPPASLAHVGLPLNLKQMVTLSQAALSYALYLRFFTKRFAGKQHK